MDTKNPKPLGSKNYGSIAHLPGEVASADGLSTFSPSMYGRTRPTAPISRAWPGNRPYGTR